MSIEISNTEGCCHLKITDEMTIYTAAQLKSEFLEHISTPNEIEVHLQGVAEIDSAGLQLMLMLHKEAARQNKQLSFKHHSQAVIDVLETLDLAGHFGDPIVMPAEETV